MNKVAFVAAIVTAAAVPMISPSPALAEESDIIRYVAPPEAAGKGFRSPNDVVTAAWECAGAGGGTGFVSFALTECALVGFVDKPAEGVVLGPLGAAAQAATAQITTSSLLLQVCATATATYVDGETRSARTCTPLVVAG